ncbi:MAG: hypothetical protein M0Z69_04820 [Actinomycetota bacterium]|nr:hypothetical protein [Actinomycetota bacterium]
MDDFENVAAELAERFGLDVALIARAPALRAAFLAAGRHMCPAAFVNYIVARGEIGSARNPYAVLVARARECMAAVETRARVEGERADARRRDAAMAVARHRQVLDRLVDAGELTPEEAAEELARRGLVAAPDAEQAVLR